MSGRSARATRSTSGSTPISRQPVTMEPGADLMLLHPDGSEEVLVAGGDGSITDPVVSFDGQWVYYVHIYNLQKREPVVAAAQGADIFKIHVKTRKIVRLTNQQFIAQHRRGELGRAIIARTKKGKTHFDYGVFNMGPCPLPGGRIVFTSNRDGFRPAKGYPGDRLATLRDGRRTRASADDDVPANLEKIGHLNIAGACIPVVLTTAASCSARWNRKGFAARFSGASGPSIPTARTGARWSAPSIRRSARTAFTSRRSFRDGSIDRRGVLQPEQQRLRRVSSSCRRRRRRATPAFGPAYMRDPRNQAAGGSAGTTTARRKYYRMPFMPTGSVSLTPFAHEQRRAGGPRRSSDDKNSPAGRQVHASLGAPDNHLLTVYSPGPVNHQYTYLPQLDGGIYLIKDGEVVDEPAQMRLIKNDPNYNESWPRAVVPYKRIYGIDEPRSLPRLANDGKLSPHLPDGNAVRPGRHVEPLQARELSQRRRARRARSPRHSPARTIPGRGSMPFTSHGNGMPLNWHNQGADAGLYANDDIHAIRILAMEPTTDRKRGDKSGRQFYSHASERLRILGEIPVRKFTARMAQQPLDPDGNPDTSFLAKIPADAGFTFQTLDKHGMVLNMAQTWHQLRPGEIRNDCGGCHAHSQKPTHSSSRWRRKPDYKVFDLTEHDAARDREGAR